MTALQLFPLARRSAGHAPPRRPESIRRTTSIDCRWPEGREKPFEMIGRARDLLTRADGSPVELSGGGFSMTVSRQREILAIEVTPPHPRTQEMVGVRAGGASRMALGEVMGDVRGSPAYQLVDDFAGTSLVCGWIWHRWADLSDWDRSGDAERLRQRMLNICVGWADGSTAFDLHGPPQSKTADAEVLPLEDPLDPAGWHAMPKQEGPQARRSRRIDLWREDGMIKVDAGFQDSGTTPTGERIAVHEYRVYAEIHEATGELLALQALPLILPFQECPGASIKATRLIGRHVADFREAVVEVLPSTLGCTHLNDVLRALADVPRLAQDLPEAPPSRALPQ
jgi:hypothetical protein